MVASAAPLKRRDDYGVPCKVSTACQEEMKRNLSNGKNYVPLGCSIAPRYFECLCGRTNSLGVNAYFDAHCVFSQCGDDSNKIAFIITYREACDEANKQLVDIPDEWVPFAQRPLLPQTSSDSPTISTPLPSSPSAVDTPPTNSPPTDAATSVMSTTSTDTKIMSAASSISPKPSKSSSIMTATTSVAPSSSYGAGFQFPICNIEPHCMRKGDGKPMCDIQDFKCICQVSNSMANNTQFDQQCVLDDCTGDMAKEEFLDYLTYQCGLTNTTLIDIPKQWERYLPSSYQTSPAVPPFSKATSTTVAAPRPNPYSASEPLSDGAKAGIGIGVLAALAIFTALAVTFYRAKRKVKQVQKRNAELVDRQSAHGVSAYIRNLTGKSTTSLPMTEGGTTVIGDPPFVQIKGLPQSPTMTKPVVPWSEGPGVLQRQYSESEYGDEITPVGQARGGGVWDEVHGGGGARQGGASGYAEHIQRGEHGVYPPRGEYPEERPQRGYYD